MLRVYSRRKMFSILQPKDLFVFADVCAIFDGGIAFRRARSGWSLRRGEVSSSSSKHSMPTVPSPGFLRDAEVSHITSLTRLCYNLHILATTSANISQNQKHAKPCPSPIIHPPETSTFSLSDCHRVPRPANYSCPFHAQPRASQRPLNYPASD